MTVAACRDLPGRPVCASARQELGVDSIAKWRFIGPQVTIIVISLGWCWYLNTAAAELGIERYLSTSWPLSK